MAFREFLNIFPDAAGSDDWRWLLTGDGAARLFSIAAGVGCPMDGPQYF